MNTPVYDFIAVGIGPFNLSLACLTSTLEDVQGLFLDQRRGFDWHPGLMIEGVHLQTPFMSDLVTLADPTHPLSFLNYIKQQGRLYSFYIREDFFLLREEYNQYCQWAASQLGNLRWQQRVESATYHTGLKCYQLKVTDTATDEQQIYYARKLVLGTGPSPFVPPCCEAQLQTNPLVLHSGDYLYRKESLQQQSAITVVGSGQSAAEIFHDLLQDMDQCGYALNWVTSAPRFYPLEYTKLTLEMTSPEYVDYFYNLPPGYRKQLVKQQKNLYKGINGDLINGIFDLLYSRQVKHRNENLPVNILTNSELRTIKVTGSDPQTDSNYRCDGPPLELGFYHREQQQRFNLCTGGLILATGYQYREPEFLLPLKPRIRYDEDGQFDVHRNYAIDHQGRDLFVQNAELHTHGFVTPDLGMACYRNSCLIREITGKEHYPIEQQIAFQQFGAPDTDKITASRPMDSLLTEQN